MPKRFSLFQFNHRMITSFEFAEQCRKSAATADQLLKNKSSRGVLVKDAPSYSHPYMNETNGFRTKSDIEVPLPYILT